MVNIVHRIGIEAPIARVYHALSTIEGIAGWWSKETSGESASGGTIEIAFQKGDGTEMGRMQMRVLVLEPNQAVHWQFIAGPQEWIRTEVDFQLKTDGNFTIVLFRHANWPVENEFTSHCSMKWATFLLSLKAFAETGSGNPSPNDLKIDNWN